MPPSGAKEFTPSVLLLSSKFDFTCDYVVSELREIGADYFRLTTEDLPSCAVSLDPIGRTASLRTAAFTVTIQPATLKAVYFRQPVYLRESSIPAHGPNDSLARVQWSAFVRSFMLFSECLWVNSPSATYVAEHKALQLHCAHRLGFDVPPTAIANTPEGSNAASPVMQTVAVKGLDTVLVSDGEFERFGYTQLIPRRDLRPEVLAAAPALFQLPLIGKLDLRVTVVGSQAWCASITNQGCRIEGDWRTLKHDLAYSEYVLPQPIQQRCIELVAALGLIFGAIDLALVDDRFYFLEINPTGEWLWLEAAVGFPIAAAIARTLFPKVDGLAA